MFGIDYNLYRVFAAAIALAAIVVFFLFLHRTKLGTWMRAVRHDREAAIAMGIPAQRIFMVTFALGTAMAPFGGLVPAPLTTTAFHTGGPILPFFLHAFITHRRGPLTATRATPQSRPPPY